MPFLEALRQMKADVGTDNVMYIHRTLIPYLKAAGEMKTKPTQHSVKRATWFRYPTEYFGGTYRATCFSKREK